MTYEQVPAEAAKVLEHAAEIIQRYVLVGNVMHSPEVVREYVHYKLFGKEREVFAILLLTTQHRLIEFRELFVGTIDQASVYPREIVKVVLETNAAAVILAHNHPSGEATASQSDIAITNKIKKALDLIDVPVLDHIIVGDRAISFAERGLL